MSGDRQDRRTSVEIRGFAHRNPVPAGSRIGPFLASGTLTGRDPATGEIPETLDEQAANMFGHVRELLLAAGGGTDDILTMTVRLAGYRDRAALNAQWEKMFPDPRTRPARHVVTASLDRGQLIQCDLLAVLPPDDATPVDGGPGPHTRETKESEQP